MAILQNLLGLHASSLVGKVYICSTPTKFCKFAGLYCTVCAIKWAGNWEHVKE